MCVRTGDRLNGLSEKRLGEAYLEPLTDVLLFAILEEALVVRDTVHAGTVAWTY